MFNTIKVSHPPILKTGYVGQAINNPIETYKLDWRQSKGKIELAAGEVNRGHNLDISWLRFAADTYKISADPRDYVIVEVPLVTADVPNRNMDCFPFVELTRFHPLHGRVVYQTFVGKPTFQDHDNKDPLRAKGVNFDACLRRVGNTWKVMVLAGYDRTKDPNLTKKILNKERLGFSMGALVSYTLCSVCKKLSSGPRPCEHYARYGKGGVTPEGKLVYDLCYDVNFIENSSVADPADIGAHSDIMW